jgi:3-oxoacyl-[acyl-carrier-protein] synthase-3
LDLRIRMAGIGHSVGSRVVFNEDVAHSLGLPSNWLETRTGIVERRVCAADEDVNSLARDAILAACGNAALDLVTVGSETVLIHIGIGMTQISPPPGIVLAEALGRPTLRVLSIDGVCAEPIVALEMASLLLDSGRADRVIVSSSVDFLSYINPNDPGTAGLFGAGAGAVVLERGSTDVPSAHLKSLVWETHTDFAGLGEIPVTGISEHEKGFDIHAGFYDMNGPGLARAALTFLPSMVANVLDEASWGQDDVDLVIAHQPNVRLLEMGIKAFGMRPETVVPMPVRQLGNMGPASLFVNLSLAQDSGLLVSGTRVMLLAFGLGFSCGAATLELP